ncbi:MAG: NAD(P)/FAD-dependent oxidoreductase [Microthrixaceae bacterium]
MGVPILLAVDDEPETLADLDRELTDRYGRHYRVVCVATPEAALGRLVEAADVGDDVALVLAVQWLPGMTGSDVLHEVRRTHPHARRALVIEWGEWGQEGTGNAIFDGIARGRFDQYLLRPTTSPDELFHQAISSMLLDWAEAHRSGPYTVHVVGASWWGRAYVLRSTLQACAIAHHFCLADSEEGRALVANAPQGAELPLIVFPNGQVLENPSDAQIAQAAGASICPDGLDVDLLVVGAGPAGLSAAVYGASEGLRTLVVDRGGIGGQATSSSLIRNYLGFSHGVSGRRLARNAYDQAWVFGARFALMLTVTGIETDGDQLIVSLSEGGPVRTTAVLLSMGASYRRIDVESLDALTGAGVFYGGTTAEAPALVDAEVHVVGGANSAGQAALHLARYARRVTLVVRSGSLRAGMSEYLVAQVEATPNIEVRTRTEVVGGGGDGRLEHLVLRDRDTLAEATVESQGMFVLIGAQPFTEWLPPEVARDANGFVLTGDALDRSSWPLDRSPFLLETSLPGVFAGGDVRHGSIKRVASAVGEGSIVVQLVHHLFAAQGRSPLGPEPSSSTEPIAAV